MFIHCEGCKGEVEAELVNGFWIYPRADLRSRLFYRCPTCGNWAICKPGTTQPYGPIQKRQTKKRIGEKRVTDYAMRMADFDYSVSTGKRGNNNVLQGEQE